MLAKLGLRCISAFLRIIPESVALSIGKLLGLICYYLIPIRRKVVCRQLHEALASEIAADEIRRCARRVYENLGLNLVEFLLLNPDKPEEIMAKVRRVNMERFEKAAAEGKGVLVLTAHFGNWDLLCCSQALCGHPITILSKTIKPDWLNDYWMNTRSACGIRILPERGVKEELLEILRLGGVIGFVADQHVSGKTGIPVDFFGRPASTTSGLARLAMESGSPVLPIFLFREDGGKHRMEVGEPVPITEGESPDETIHLTTRSYNAVLEKTIRKQPDHWLWLHRRWKNPDGSPKHIGEKKDSGLPDS